jgi:hypothetical protein
MHEGSDPILRSIFYAGYQSFQSVDGSSAFYNLNIISTKKILVEIPGTGISLPLIRIITIV